MDQQSKIDMPLHEPKFFGQLYEKIAGKLAVFMDYDEISEDWSIPLVQNQIWVRPQETCFVIPIKRKGIYIICITDVTNKLCGFSGVWEKTFEEV